MPEHLKSRETSTGALPSRRNLLKGAAAAGAAGWTMRFPAVHGAESGTIRIGFVGAISGPGNLFGEPCDFVKKQVEKACAGGLTIGGKNYAVEVVVRDSQSSVNVAGQIAAELMTRQKVDLIVCPESYIAITGGQMAVINKTPIVSTLFPADAMVGDPRRRRTPTATRANPGPSTSCSTRPISGPATWACGVPTSDKLDGKVGTLYSTSRRRAASPIPISACRRSSTRSITQSSTPGLFKNETDDFTNQISLFKNANARDRHRLHVFLPIRFVLARVGADWLQARDRQHGRRLPVSRAA